MDFINDPLILASPPHTQSPAIFTLLFIFIFILYFNHKLNINFEFKDTHLVDKLLILSKCYLRLILSSPFQCYLSLILIHLKLKLFDNYFKNIANTMYTHLYL